MTGIDPERLERRLRWAAEQLGLSPHASPEEVRAAWLRRLPEDDFVPSSESHWALAALLRRQQERGWETRADEAASVAAEERLRGEVEAFAAQFWDFSTDERRRRWEELAGRCAFAPALRTRLRLLKAGLDCSPLGNEVAEDAGVVKLAGHIQTLFVLRPGPRAHARQAILRRMRSDREKWKTAAPRLRHACPDFASLGDDLLDRICTTKAKTKKHAKRQPKPLPIKSVDPHPEQVSPPNVEKSRPARPRWLLLMLTPLLLVLLRLACSEKQSSTPTASDPPYRFNDTPSAPEDVGKKLQLELWKQAAEKGLLQNREFREELNKDLDEQQKEQQRERTSEKRDPPAGKSP